MSSKTFKKELTVMMESNGFELQRSASHLVWKHVSGVQIFTSATPSCRHALNQIKRQIRQKGVQIN
jgi:predicted RNA binding protein YcfA (HicA-like mRNA interferase family)